MREGAIPFQAILITRRETAEAEQPAIRALDDPPPSIPPQRTAVLEALTAAPSMRRDQLDTPVAESFIQGLAVVGFVGHYALRLLARASRACPGDGDVRERGFRKGDFREVGGRHVDAERKTRAVDQYHKLCPLTLACAADASAPFFAGAKVPSRNASLQSTWPRSSNSPRKVRQRVSHTSAASHSPSRRQQVAGLGYWSGRSRQRAPVRKTHRMPSKQARSSARGRPPRGLRLARGNSGAIFAHWASVTRTEAFRIVPHQERCAQFIVKHGF